MSDHDEEDQEEKSGAQELADLLLGTFARREKGEELQAEVTELRRRIEALENREPS